MCKEMTAAGWSKIAKVEIEQFRDENGVVDFGHVIIADVEGNLWAVQTLKGETEEENAARYERRRFTDNRCILLT